MGVTVTVSFTMAHFRRFSALIPNLFPIGNGIGLTVVDVHGNIPTGATVQPCFSTVKLELLQLSVKIRRHAGQFLGEVHILNDRCTGVLSRTGHTVDILSDLPTALGCFRNIPDNFIGRGALLFHRTGDPSLVAVDLGDDFTDLLTALGCFRDILDNFVGRSALLFHRRSDRRLVYSYASSFRI